MSNDTGTVFLLKTNNRVEGITELLEYFDISDFKSKNVGFKANFNSADTFPATTHIDTLQTLIRLIKNVEPEKIILAERSGMGDTRTVLETMGVMDIAKKEDFEVRILDEEDADNWVEIKKNGNHWRNGFYISKIFKESDKIVQTCCLKSHRFGGIFTLSLQNSVGMVAKKIPGKTYNYMEELHKSPYQRLMIAEINNYYHTDLILMDAIKAFINKGPEKGYIVTPNLLLMSNDRIAIDAAGIAILRQYNTTNNILNGSIFELEQIKRAAELGIGVQSPDKINIIGINKESETISHDLEEILKTQE